MRQHAALKVSNPLSFASHGWFVGMGGEVRMMFVLRVFRRILPHASQQPLTKTFSLFREWCSRPLYNTRFPIFFFVSAFAVCVRCLKNPKSVVVSWSDSNQRGRANDAGAGTRGLHH